MRLALSSVSPQARSFATGVAVGLSFAAVAYFAKRALTKREYADVDLSKTFIDGAKPIDPVKLTLGPAEESNSPNAARVEGELDDVSLRSQRW
jgi:hypothetical protein